jgi:hypothetical protein
MRTLVLGSERPARYSLGPHKLPIEPVVWPMVTGSAGERILKELHGEMALRRKLREPRIAAQWVAPDFRIDLGADRVAAELAREVPNAEELVQKWQRADDVAKSLDVLVADEHAFPGVGFFERREVAKLADAAGEAAAAWWQATDVALWRHFAAILLRHPAPPPIAIARALAWWRPGPASLRADGDAVRELFVEKLTTAGGEVRAGKVTELGTSWGKITSVTLQNGDDIGASQVVSSLPPAELAALLGKKAPKRLGELSESIKLVGFRYTLNLVLDEAGVPEHMAPTVAVVAAPDREPSGDAAFSIHLSEADESGRVVATLAAVLAADGPVDDDQLAGKCARLRVGLLQRLGDVMPFYDKHLVLAHSPFEATAPHVPGGRGSYDVPRNLPLAMSPVWSGSVESTAELGAASYVTGLKNLTLTGDQILPALGIEGALTAGWSAAKVACALAGTKKDYLRDEVVGAA